jgi:uncharacterized protein YegJ (DUF2314 family)
VIGFASADAAMNSAMSDAQRSMDVFLSRATSRKGRAAEGAVVKVAFAVGSGNEVIWIENFRLRRNGRMTGELANSPNHMEGYHKGDTVNFHRSDVRDWSLFSGGTLYGNYTTRVMLPQMDPATQARLSQLLSPEPLPASW